MEPLRGGSLANRLPEAAAEIFEKAVPKRSAAEWGLRWVWNHPQVHVALSGMNDIRQVKENVRAAESALPGSLSDEELALFSRVREEIARTVKVGCTGCGYCMPCPAAWISRPACTATIFHIPTEKQSLFRIYQSHNDKTQAVERLALRRVQTMRKALPTGHRDFADDCANAKKARDARLPRGGQNGALAREVLRKRRRTAAVLHVLRNFVQNALAIGAVPL
jgi:hypothetical protein